MFSVLLQYSSTHFHRSSAQLGPVGVPGKNCFRSFLGNENAKSKPTNIRCEVCDVSISQATNASRDHCLPSEHGIRSGFVPPANNSATCSPGNLGPHAPTGLPRGVDQTKAVWHLSYLRGYLSRLAEFSPVFQTLTKIAFKPTLSRLVILSSRHFFREVVLTGKDILFVVVILIPVAIPQFLHEVGWSI